MTDTITFTSTLDLGNLVEELEPHIAGAVEQTIADAVSEISIDDIYDFETSVRDCIEEFSSCSVDEAAIDQLESRTEMNENDIEELQADMNTLRPVIDMVVGLQQDALVTALRAQLTDTKKELEVARQQLAIIDEVKCTRIEKLEADYAIALQQLNRRDHEDRKS